MNLARRVMRKFVSGYRVVNARQNYPSAEQAPAQAIQEMTSSANVQPSSVVQPVVNMQPVVKMSPARPTEIPVEVQFRPVAGMPAEIKVMRVEERARIKPKLEIEGLEIPEFVPKKIREKTLSIEEEPRKKIIYSLIPRKPGKDERTLAAANIYWDEKNGKYVYEVLEPQVSDKITDIIATIKEVLEDRLDVDFSKLKLVEAKDFLFQQVDDILRLYKISLSPDELLALKYYVERDFIGLGKIEPLMRDQEIEDISCDGIGIPVFVFYRSQEIGSVATNIVFKTAEELDSFATRLAQLTGKSISLAEPLVDGTLPDGSRLQTTLATDIARKGSNFTIRKFVEEPLTPVHLLEQGTLDVKSLAYLWMAVDFGRSVLVSGGTASGKTTFLNVLSLFIRSDKKIISIEDTAELRLPHPHWVPTVARTSVSTEGGAGEVDMFRLLKESLRQRPDYIIVGEVRGQEAFILFQQMATGHPSMATIHAEKLDKLVDRLTTAPISLPKSLIGSLDLVIFMAKMKYKEKFVRRVTEIVEMIDFDQESDEPVISTAFKRNPVNDKMEIAGKSVLLKKISESTGLKEQEILEELGRRMLVLNWLQEHGVRNYQDVYAILNMYYYYPNRVLDAIKGEI